MRIALLAVLLGACGGPALQNAPHPNNAAMAGGFAALAGAATLASPRDATKKPEEKGPAADTKPMKVKETVPAGVFDRLDAQDAKGSATTAAKPDDETRGAPLLVPAAPAPKL
jgi:hypothetical protein